MKIYYGLAILAMASPAQAWSPAQEPPQIPLKSFVLPEGLEITPWALSPALFNPTNMDIDQRGRVWVTEGVNYRGKAGRQPGGDRVVILEDTDGDGKCDKSSIFWQDPELVSPLGIAVFDNVVIISQPPNLLKLTDVNRDSKFDPKDGDTREVLLTGFNGKNHDHSLHSLTGGPDGKWYFNQGNTCGVFTDKSGKTFRIGSSYYKSGGGEWPIDTKAIAGQASDDGFTYVGGFTIRMNPDATHAECVGYGYRNSYEQTLTSNGNVFQNDNDDPPACRTSHVLEYGNAGYFSNDGTRFWGADQRPGQNTPIAHWRQQDPGSMPPGDVYGGGAPTGIAYYENGALGAKFAGTLLSCESARNVIFAYQPAADGAGFQLDRTDFVTTNPDKKFVGADFTGGSKNLTDDANTDKNRFNFRPSDVCVGPDGALYVTDWTDPRVGGHATQDEAASGVVYRIAPKGFNPVVPKIDLTTIEGAALALKSPAVNVRWLGFQKLKSSGPVAFDAVEKILKDSDSYIAARGIWLLPYLGEKGKDVLTSLLASTDPATRLTAFRAIRRTDGAIDDLPYAVKLATDPNPKIRAEAAIAMRYRKFAEACSVLLDVAKAYDGKDRSYLESLGIGAGHNTEALWKALVEAMKPSEPATWSDTFALLTWRLKPEAAVTALKARAADEKLNSDQRKLAVDSIAFINSRASADALIDLATESSAVREQVVWWLTNRSEGEWASFNLKPELEERGILQKPVPLAEITVPAKPLTAKFTIADVVALKGDASRGKPAAGRCVMCHQINGNGPDYGPDLKGFGSRQPVEVIAKAMIDPSADISHGFDGTTIRLKDGKTIQGRVIADGNPVVIRSTGGFTQKVPKNQIAERKNLDQSLMLSADQLGMTALDVADVIEWMKTY